ncbi:hypothetical protein SAMN02910289_00376 [Lachnospiraceae bacterium RM5]|nr:hypothetical protein SAMN02910289_00376 [Lachnospiraceae bacterium RM5]
MNILNINQNVSVIRDYSAGSNAITILCMDEKSKFYRKYAYGPDSDKLFQQIEWIKRNETLLPLPQIIRKGKNESFCFYDMAYNGYQMGMFEYAHSMPIYKTWDILDRVLLKLENSIYLCETRSATKEDIKAYYQNKIKKNIDCILNCEYLLDLQKYEFIDINGVRYKNLLEYIPLLSELNARLIFSDDPCSVIHGDLTLENIICTRNDLGEDYFYLIDPNTGNLHDSKYLDYAKLLQSLHGEYELVKSVEHIKVNQNKVTFSYKKSIVYRELYALYQSYLQEHFDEASIKSIYFHEIIHWLRLMPCQIKNNKGRVIAFYARLLMLLDEILKKYGKNI